MRKCTFVAAAFTVAVCVLLGACAAKLVPAPVVTTPKFPDFVRPIVPPEFADSPAAARHARGWAFLESGDLRTAEREFAAALALAPAFHPAQASLGRCHTSIAPWNSRRGTSPRSSAAGTRSWR